ncbi:ORF1022 [White spot syndrome virus]|uniref:ORF1022 n=1 Tax=White spot syndrome virus TaxID=342409 RepID=A0A2D3I641_9VIRU|nr:ORF1022 [White spot syndrome virus]
MYQFTSSLLLKNFSKNFSARSSLEGGPLGRPNVKFGGWTSGSTRCQITPETSVAPETYINSLLFLEQAFLDMNVPRKGSV